MKRKRTLKQWLLLPLAWFVLQEVMYNQHKEDKKYKEWLKFNKRYHNEHKK